jgi:hypothetical protein
VPERRLLRSSFKSSKKGTADAKSDVTMADECRTKPPVIRERDKKLSKSKRIKKDKVRRLSIDS